MRFCRKQERIGWRPRDLALEDPVLVSMGHTTPHLFGKIENEMQREAGRGARKRQAGKP
ncbi:hypothetical protein D9M68_140330 [compost metagenome]